MTARWYGFYGTFRLGHAELLVRVGTCTDVLHRLAELYQDAAFPPGTCAFLPLGDRATASSFDRAVLDRIGDLRTQGHWLRAPLQVFSTLPVIWQALAEGITGERLQWTATPLTVLDSYRADRRARTRLPRAKLGTIPLSNVTALDDLRHDRELAHRAPPAAIDQVRAILSDGRCVSVQRLAAMIEPPVKVDSLRSMLSRHPDFSYIERLGWVLTTAQRQQQALLTEGAGGVHSASLEDSARCAGSTAGP